MREVLLAGKDICREFQGNTGGWSIILNRTVSSLFIRMQRLLLNILRWGILIIRIS